MLWSYLLKLIQKALHPLLDRQQHLQQHHSLLENRELVIVRWIIRQPR